MKTIHSTSTQGSAAERRGTGTVLTETPFKAFENTHSTACDISAQEFLDSSKDSDKEILMEGKDEECTTDTSSNDVFP